MEAWRGGESKGGSKEERKKKRNEGRKLQYTR